MLKYKPFQSQYTACFKESICLYVNDFILN